VSQGFVGILNLDMGNLRSVSNAIASLGHDCGFVAAPDELARVTHLVIPGVGSFHTAMRRVTERGLRDPVRGFAASGRPVLGLCLGMQLLGSRGEEGEASRGFDLVPGCVRKLDARLAPAIPHVGWNSVDSVAPHPVLAGIRSGVDFYFVHSYHLSADDPTMVLGTTEYGERFASIVGRDNIVGFQFHPEKSQASGLRLIDDFCGWDGTC